MNDEQWKALNAVSRLHTITFRYPKTFLNAVASSLGRIGDSASTMEAETFIREAVKANIECLMEEHLHRKSVMKARVNRTIADFQDEPSGSTGNGRMTVKVRRRTT